MKYFLAVALLSLSFGAFSKQQLGQAKEDITDAMCCQGPEGSCPQLPACNKGNTSESSNKTSGTGQGSEGTGQGALGDK